MKKDTEKTKQKKKKAEKKYKDGGRDTCRLVSMMKYVKRRPAEEGDVR